MKHFQNFTDTQYQGLLRNILLNGTKKANRTGTDAISIFGANLKINLQDGFPLLTTKKMAWNQIVTELRWFLKGDTNIKFLLDNNCHIWNDDAYKAYRKRIQKHYEKGGEIADKDEFIKFAKEEGDEDWGYLGPIYGKQWRAWEGSSYNIDQLSDLITNLREDPNSRRHIVSAWNVGELGQMSLPPCHYSFQCYIRGDYLDLLWNQRSADVFLGVPFNIASYALLTHMIAKEINKKPGNLIGNFGDIHLYENHIEQATEQIKRKPYKLPTINIESQDILNGEIEVELKGYKYHPAIIGKLST